MRYNYRRGAYSVHRLSGERWKSLTWCSRNKLSPTALIAIAMLSDIQLQLYDDNPQDRTHARNNAMLYGYK